MTMEQQRVVHLVPHFHYDTVYLKTYEQYLEPALSHIHEALRIMSEEPAYTFMIEQTILLEEYWERFPEQRSLLRQFAQEGRLEVACGMYCMPDMNIPSGESFIRQVAKGKRWVKEHLGIDVHVAWVSDSFGHHPQLPQLLQHCGYHAYVFGRGMDPDALTPFRWSGIDGTQLLTHRLHGGYGLIMFSQSVDNALELNLNTNKGADAIRDRIRFLETVSSDSRDLLLPNGGDMAKPQKEAITAVEDYNRRYKDNAVCILSSVHQYVSSIREHSELLPLLSPDLNPVTPGIYSSRMGIKLWNRKIEGKLQLAERWQAAISLIRSHSKASTEVIRRELELEHAWQQLLFNQFHDIISGTIVDAGYLDSMRRYKEADACLERVIASLKKEMVASSAPLVINELHDVVLMVMNPSCFTRKEVVRFQLETSLPNISGATVLDENGNDLETQFRIITEDQRGPSRIELRFIDCMEGLSSKRYKVIWKRHEESVVKQQEPSHKISQSPEGISFENSLCRIQIANNGCIVSYRLKASGCEWIPQGKGWNDILLLSDTGDLWLYDDPIINGAYYGPMDDVFQQMAEDTKPYVKKRLGSSLRSKGTLTIKDEDADKIIVESKGNLRFWRMLVDYVTTIFLYKDSGKIGFETKLTGRGRQYRLIAAFPTELSGGQLLQEIPFGTVKRESGEYPAQNWSALEEGDRGVLITNVGIAGNGRLDGTLYLALTRSVSIDYKTESELAYEEGETHVYRYEIEPYEGKTLSELKPWRSGEQLILPLVTAVYPAGTMLLNIDEIKVISETVHLTGLYYREGKWTIRIYEAGGSHAWTTVHFPSTTVLDEPLYFWEENGIGDRVSEPTRVPESIEVELTAYQIKTFAFGLKPSG